MSKQLHFGLVQLSRSKERPDNAVAALAYRSGQNLYDDKLGKTHCYQSRDGVINFALFAPENAPDWMHNPDQKQAWQELGNQIEAKEDSHKRKAQARLGNDFQAALPRELSDEQNWQVAQNFARKLNDRGLAAAIAFHKPVASDGLPNPHLHVFVPLRNVSEKGFGQRYDQFDTRKGSKNAALKKLRQEYFACVNEAIKEAGIEGVYFDPEKQQGQSEIHYGKNAWQLKEKGVTTRIEQKNEQIACENFMDNRTQFADGLKGITLSRDRAKRIAELQAQRGSAMAARDASIKSQSSVTSPQVKRSGKTTEGVRHAAQLSAQLSQTHVERLQKSREGVHKPDSGLSHTERLKQERQQRQREPEMER